MSNGKPTVKARPEAAIEQALGRELRRLGCLYLKWVSPGSVGVPDRIVVCPDGRIVFAELKARYGTLSAQQRYFLKELSARGAETRVVRGEEGAQELLREMKERYGTTDL